MKGVSNHVAEETSGRESQGRCLLTNPGASRGATLRATGIERRAGLEKITLRCVRGEVTGSRASRRLAKAVTLREMLTEARRCFQRGTGGSTQGEVVRRTGEALPVPGRNPLEQGRCWQQRRRSEGGRWVCSSEEPPVMRRDPAKSRGRRAKSEWSVCAKEPSWSRIRDRGVR